MTASPEPTPGAGTRRVGKEDSETRGQILDGVERLLLASGYAAVTYRAVATQVGVTPSLIQYYFPTLDELLVGAVQRRTDQSLQRLSTMLDERSHEPLRAIWDFSNDETSAKLTIEFSALGNHRESVRTHIAEHTNRLRSVQLEALIDTDSFEGLSNEAALFLLSGIPKLVRMEADFDIDVGHADIADLVEGWLDRHEPHRT